MFNDDVLNKYAIPTERVFVYETLLDKMQRFKIIHRDVHSEIDILPNYLEVSFNTKEGDDYHTIIPKNGEAVLGQVLFVTPEELKILDDWESAYKRKQVVTKRHTVSWTYILRKEFITFPK